MGLIERHIPKLKVDNRLSNKFVTARRNRISKGEGPN
jgi:hypothetical protein